MVTNEEKQVIKACMERIADYIFEVRTGKISKLSVDGRLVKAWGDLWELTGYDEV